MFDSRFVSDAHMANLRYRVDMLVRSGVSPDAFVYPIFHTEYVPEEIADNELKGLSDPNTTNTYEELVKTQLPWFRLRDYWSGEQ